MNRKLPFVYAALLMLLMPAAYAQTISTGLVAYYPFNNSTADVTGNGYDGTNNGALFTTDYSGNSLSAALFTGTTNIDINSPSGLNGMSEFTISAWIYPNGGTGDRTIISKVGPDRDFVLKINGAGELDGHFNDGTYRFCTTNSPISLNVWTHVAWCWDGSESKMYQNGTLVKTCDHTGSAPPWLGSQMGIGSMGGGELWSGVLDEIRIWNRCLSDSELNMVATSLDEPGNAGTAIHIFPNVNHQSITLQADRADLSTVQVQLLDLQGKLIDSGTVNLSAGLGQFDVSNHAGGLYVIRVSGENVMTSRKLYLTK